MQYILTIRPGIPIECRQKIEAVLKEFNYWIKATESTVKDNKVIWSEILFENET